jgi:hypothetical protein
MGAGETGDRAVIHTPHIHTAGRRYVALIFAVTAAYVFAGLQLHAQLAPKQLTIDDYTRWKSLSGSALSGDGNWAVYELRQANVPTSDARPTTHLVNLVTNETRQLVNASGAAFSDDSRWIAYSIEPAASGRGAA